MAKLHQRLQCGWDLPENNYPASVDFSVDIPFIYIFHAGNLSSMPLGIP